MRKSIKLLALPILGCTLCICASAQNVTNERIASTNKTAVSVKDRDSTHLKTSALPDTVINKTVFKNTDLDEDIQLKDSMLSFNSMDYFYIPISFVAGCLLVSLVWYAKSRKRKKRKSTSETKKMSPEESRDREISLIEKENLNLFATVKELNQKISDLEARLIESDLKCKKAEDTIGDLYVTIKNLESITLEKVKDHSNETFEEPSKYLFFPSPLPGGSFRKVDGKDTFLEGASIYRFKMISETEAKFEFCEDSSSVGMALNNRVDLILSVAEEMEGNSSGAKKILTYNGETGKVVLEDTKWIIVKKIKIKYV
ncbi:hypothetical protein DBR11_14365 [Pedobacter sp. HMWF019]|uniref:hypothetical protein n=1 Tax=Pedobacter sp. HMWF019 TaxID=2056856 RepID=UPI000D3C3428|nr:hypothetical protein [Pedobacter sp. HMWF019]PTS98625.1 hypothetical protein DBR11_14365 [Pedobacter sp. HMWF019]